MLRDFRSHEKVIGLTCIAPVIAAKIFGNDGVKMTLGGSGDNFPYAGSIGAASSFGAEMVEMDVNQVCIDWKNNIITTPAYMQGDASPHAVFDGIQDFLRKVNSLVRQKEATMQANKRESSDVQKAKATSEDDLMMRLVM